MEIRSLLDQRAASLHAIAEYQREAEPEREGGKTLALTRFSLRFQEPSNSNH